MSKKTDPVEVIKGRGATHGDWHHQSALAVMLKSTCHASKNWQSLTAGQREAVDMIAVKLSRFLTGDPNEPDHMIDVAGYAALANKSRYPE